LNILSKFCREKSIDMKPFYEEKIDVLFKLSHSSSLKLRYQVLRLIFYMSRSYDKEKLDRYYKSLYELLLSKEVQNSRKIKEIFKLLLESINFDSNITRISAFLKRLLQISLFAEPPFIACSLLITSQIIRNKNKLWKLFDKPESKNGQYDNLKREPKFSDGDSIPIYELIPFTEHYHPTIKAFANHILQFFNSKIIEYSSDPIIDLSLVNFLDKFILKNPDSKSKREMKKTKN